MRQLYSLLLTLGVLVTSPYWLLRALRENKYFANFRQRLGWQLPELPVRSRPLWLHVVSVGEVAALRPLFNVLRREKPDLPLIVSTVTLTGQDFARKELKGADGVFFFPFDWSAVVARFLRRLQPRAVVLLETELWPNFLAAARRRRIPVLLVNGRLSDQSLRRYRWVRSFVATMLKQVERIGVQSSEDYRRFVEIGAREDQVTITGNLKFDFSASVPSPAPEWLVAIRSALGASVDSLVVVVGSSMRGEEPFFVDAFVRVRRELPQARLVLAPRHPERFDEVAALLRQSGLSFARRTELVRASGRDVDVVLLDTIGELRTVYSIASLAVIGGSFLPFGGHNLLEPAALGKPVIFGPHMSNFRAMADAFLRAEAARQTSLDGLAELLIELLRSPRVRTLLGQRASMTVCQNQGATAKTMDLIRPYLD